MALPLTPGTSLFVYRLTVWFFFFCTDVLLYTVRCCAAIYTTSRYSAFHCSPSSDCKHRFYQKAKRFVVLWRGEKLRPLMVNCGNTSLERRGHTAAALVLLTDLSDSCCSASSSYVWTLNSRLSALRVQPAKVKDKQRNWNTWENKKESRSSCVVPPRVAQSSDNKAEGIGASTGGERLGELTTRKLRPPLGKYWTGLRTFAAAV